MTAAALTDEQYDLVRSYAMGEAPAQLAKDRGLTRAQVVHELTELCELNPDLARQLAVDEEHRRTAPPAVVLEEPTPTESEPVDEPANVRCGVLLEEDARPLPGDGHTDYRAYRCMTCGRIGPEPCDGHASVPVTVRIFESVMAL